MNIRESKGITLISEVIAVIILVMITSIIYFSSISGLQIRNLNNMYSDIISIQEKAINYYLKYGEAPVTIEQPSANVISSIQDEENPNDEAGKYYKVDIDALTNLSLNNKQDTDSYYFMNTKTLTVYHTNGVLIDNLNNDISRVYHTVPSNYQDITELEVDKYKD